MTGLRRWCLYTWRVSILTRSAASFPSLFARRGGLCLLLVLFQAPCIPPAAAVGLAPAQGLFLVARREMLDPNFREAVVLLLRHDDEGTLGLTINRPGTVSLAEALPKLAAAKGTAHRVSLGGPMAVDRAIFLIRAPKSMDNVIPVVGDIAFSMDAGVLERLLAEHKPSSELRVYAGHAGWLPGQLQQEIGVGGWLVVRPDGELDAIFGQSLDTLWQTLIDRHDPQGLLVLNRR